MGLLDLHIRYYFFNIYVGNISYIFEDFQKSEDFIVPQ